MALLALPLYYYAPAALAVPLIADPVVGMRPLLRSQSSITTVLKENPIQNAIPKNWCGVRCVSGAVAKKNTHHRPSCGNTEYDRNRAQHPALLLQPVTRVRKLPGPIQREKEQRIEYENSRALNPSPDRIDTHSISCYGNYHPHHKNRAFKNSGA